MPRIEARWVSRITTSIGTSSSNPMKAERIAAAQPVSCNRSGSRGNVIAAWMINQMISRLRITMNT